MTKPKDRQQTGKRKACRPTGGAKRGVRLHCDAGRAAVEGGDEQQLAMARQAVESKNWTLLLDLARKNGKPARKERGKKATIRRFCAADMGADDILETLVDAFAEDGAALFSNKVIVNRNNISVFRELLRHSSVVEDYGRRPDAHGGHIAQIESLGGGRTKLSAMLGREQQKQHPAFGDSRVLKAFEHIFEKIWDICKVVLLAMDPDCGLDLTDSNAAGPVVREEVYLVHTDRPCPTQQLVQFASPYQCNMHAILALTDIEDAPYCIPYNSLGGDPLRIAEQSFLEKDANMQIKNEDAREFLRRRFGSLLLDPTTRIGEHTNRERPTEAQASLGRKVRLATELLESGYPVTGYTEKAKPNPLKAGDTLIFFGDFLLYGPRVHSFSDARFVVIPFDVCGAGPVGKPDSVKDALWLAEAVYGGLAHSCLTQETMLAYTKAMGE